MDGLYNTSQDGAMSSSNICLQVGIAMFLYLLLTRLYVDTVDILQRQSSTIGQMLQNVIRKMIWNKIEPVVM